MSTEPSGTDPDPRRTPLIAGASIFGKKWHLVVLQRLLRRGPMGFSELARSVEGLSNKVLSNCLDDLQAQGLVTRQVLTDRPYRVQYALTDYGETLEPVLAAMEDWGTAAVERVTDRSEAALAVPR